MKKALFPLVGLLLLIGCDDTADETTTKTEVVRPAKIVVVKSEKQAQFKTFPGVTEAAKKSVLAFRVSGKIVELPVLAGQKLKKGDLIARLDQTDFKNTVAERQATFDLAKVDLSRQKTLYQKQHVAKSKLDASQSTFSAASAGLKQANDNLAYTRLTAPFDGVVSRVDVKNFQNVQAGTVIIQFQDDTEIEVIFNVPESLFLRLNENNTNEGRLKVRFDALPGQEFDALYREHDLLPDTTTRSFKVTAVMPIPKDLTVLPGMSVSVIANLSKVYGEDAKRIAIPIEAVFERDGDTWVWRLDAEDKAQPVKVSTGDLADGSIQVTNGLTAGDRVVAAGVNQVREGQKVRPLVKERGL